jgi:hypothetical protein
MEKNNLHNLYFTKLITCHYVLNALQENKSIIDIYFTKENTFYISEIIA